MPDEVQTTTSTELKRKGILLLALGHPLIAGAVLVILSATVTVPITLWVQTYNNRLRAFDYQVIATPAILRRPDLEGKQFQISIDGKPIENLSTIKVQIFNRSDTDYEDVPIQIMLAGTVPNVVQAKSQLGPITTVTPQTQPIVAPGHSVTFSYLLKVANRSTLPVFECDYTLEGSQAPSVTVAIEKKGLEATVINPNAHPSILYSVVVGLSPAAFAILILALIIWFPPPKLRRRHEASLAKSEASIAKSERLIEEHNKELEKGRKEREELQARFAKFTEK